MKWFKHFSDNYRGRSIEAFFDEMGHTGVACYFIILEIYTEKLEVNTKEKLEKSDFILRFPLGFVRRNLRISQGKLEDFLRFSQGLGLFSYEIIGKELKIEMPILLDLLHSDVTKTRSRREQYKNNAGPDKDKEEEEDKDKEENTFSDPKESELVDSGLKLSREAVSKKPKQDVFCARAELERIYKDFYPRKDGKTPGLKKLTQKNNPKGSVHDSRILNQQDLLDFEKAVKNYLIKIAGKNPEFTLKFSTFAGEWRDHVDFVPMQVQQVKKVTL